MCVWGTAGELQPSLVHLNDAAVGAAIKFLGFFLHSLKIDLGMLK